MSPVREKPEAVVILSGGMDSTCAAYWAKKMYGEIACISFDYGQRHKIELDYAQATAERLHAPWHKVDLTGITKLLGGSALTDDIDVPEGHYTEENMKVTVVPNRNSIMANIAGGYAVAVGAQAIVLGIHAGDHAVYPDCRPEFVDALEELLIVANEGFIDLNFTVQTPFLHKTKADIVKIGDELDVPWQFTWTCYNGDGIHCGRCATCVERLEAFHLAESSRDLNTKFADRTYYKEKCGL